MMTFTPTLIKDIESTYQKYHDRGGGSKHRNPASPERQERLHLLQNQKIKKRLVPQGLDETLTPEILCLFLNLELLRRIRYAGVGGSCKKVL
jgi:hypothetical protein